MPTPLTKIIKEGEGKFPFIEAIVGGEKFQVISIESHLSRQLALLKGVKKINEEGKAEKPTGHPQKFAYTNDWYVGYNAALTSVIALLDKTIKEVQ